MYFSDKSQNHRKGLCADGVWSKAAPDLGIPTPPDWPQPQDIFSMGKLFNPTTFLCTVRDLYEKIADHTTRNPDIPFETSLEEQAFLKMVNTRKAVVKNDCTFFQLYENLQFIPGSGCESLVSELEGHSGRYLRIDCL